MRKRIRSIKAEKVSSTIFRERQQLKKMYMKGNSLPFIIREDSLHLPSSLPDYIAGGLLWNM